MDTAKRYGVESFLAQAIKDSRVDRSDIFLTTKLWPTDYGKNKTKMAAFDSMKRLETDYLDLYMLHFPVCPSSVDKPKKVLHETWRELELLLDEVWCSNCKFSEEIKDFHFEYFRNFFRMLKLLGRYKELKH